MTTTTCIQLLLQLHFQ